MSTRWAKKRTYNNVYVLCCSALCGSGQSISEIIDSHCKHHQQTVHNVSNGENTAYHGRPVTLLSDNDVAYQRHPSVANDPQQTSSQLSGHRPLESSPRGSLGGPPPWRLPDRTDSENDVNYINLLPPQGQYVSSAPYVSGKVAHSEQHLKQGNNLFAFSYWHHVLDFFCVGF